MTDELEQALRRALRPQGPGEDFSGHVVSRLDPSGRERAAIARLRPAPIRRFGPRWVPAAIAACLIAAIGLVQLRQHAVDAARAEQARAQLLLALRIASDNVNIVRAAVAREEHPDS